MTKWRAPTILAAVLAVTVVLSLRAGTGHRTIAASQPAPMPATQPVSAEAWEYRTICMYDLTSGLEPAPNFDGGLRWRWGGMTSDSDSPEAKRAREAEEHRRDQAEQRQRESNKVFEQRLSKTINDMSAQGFEPCAPPAGFLRPELNDCLSMIWFRRVR